MVERGGTPSPGRDSVWTPFGTTGNRTAGEMLANILAVSPSVRKTRCNGAACGHTLLGAHAVMGPYGVTHFWGGSSIDFG